jgi:hypothetical protein
MSSKEQKRVAVMIHFQIIFFFILAHGNVYNMHNMQFTRRISRGFHMERLHGGAFERNQTNHPSRDGRGPVCITRVSSMGLLNPYFHDDDLGFSLFLERRSAEPVEM